MPAFRRLLPGRGAELGVSLRDPPPSRHALRSPAPLPQKIKWEKEAAVLCKGCLSPCVSGGSAGPQHCWQLGVPSRRLRGPCLALPSDQPHEADPGRESPAARGSGILRPLRPQR